MVSIPYPDTPYSSSTGGGNLSELQRISPYIRTAMDSTIRVDCMISYNVNDVDSTEELLNRCKKDIDLRIAIEEDVYKRQD